MACISRFTTAILSGETELALGTILWFHVDVNISNSFAFKTDRMILKHIIFYTQDKRCIYGWFPNVRYGIHKLT